MFAALCPSCSSIAIVLSTLQINLRQYNGQLINQKTLCVHLFNSIPAQPEATMIDDFYRANAFCVVLPSIYTETKTDICNNKK